MNCKWEELTVPDFVRVVKRVKGVCVVPLGVLEKHGDHLPIGTDGLNIRAVAERAVAREPAMLFPLYYFSQIQEAKQWPGTVAVRRDVLFGLLENLCDEIARNGLRKIVLLNGHGGNGNFLDHFVFSLLEKPRDYVVYLAQPSTFWEEAGQSAEWKAQMVSRYDYHGGEMETSLTLASREDLVKMADRSAPTEPLGRAGHLRGLKSSLWWYADFPDHYAGDAARATREKGEFLMERFAARVASMIRAAKEDRITPRLLAEYCGRMAHPLETPSRAKRAASVRVGGRK